MPARTRTALLVALTLTVASLGIARPARAQDVALAPAPVAVPVAPQPVATPSPVGPTTDAAAVGVRQAPTAATAAAPRGGYGQSVALMVVGGAAVLVGLIIGGGAGTAIAIGGAVAGLVGLYQYLQ
jgi:hypothetical protein